MDHHRFERTTDDDNTCLDCGVLVDDLVLEALMLTCPVRVCQDPSNDGEPCVFVASETVPVCAYCDRNGDPHGEYDGSGDLWGELEDLDSEQDDEITAFPPE